MFLNFSGLVVRALLMLGVERESERTWRLERMEGGWSSSSCTRFLMLVLDLARC
jgi:hypothetical protein